MSEIPLKDSFVHQGAALVHVQIFHYHCGIADCESPVSSASAAITAYLICMSNESERPPPPPPPPHSRTVTSLLAEQPVS